VQQHALGVAADADELPEGLSLLREARRRRIAPGHDAAHAQVGMATQTLRAVPAEAGQAGHHVIARAHGRHLRSDRLHHTGALVAQDDRPIERVPRLALHDVEIAVADTRRRRPHEHLAARGLVDLDRLDRQGLVRLPEDSRLDLHPSPSRLNGPLARRAMAVYATPGAP
jgi:hypothetical protein